MTCLNLSNKDLVDRTGKVEFAGKRGRIYSVKKKGGHGVREQEKEEALNGRSQQHLSERLLLWLCVMEQGTLTECALSARAHRTVTASTGNKSALSLFRIEGETTLTLKSTWKHLKHRMYQALVALSKI